MAIRKRTTKLLAKRHDLNYFKKGSPIRLWQWKLALVALIAAVAWVALSPSTARKPSLPAPSPPRTPSSARSARPATSPSSPVQASFPSASAPPARSRTPPARAATPSASTTPTRPSPASNAAPATSSTSAPCTSPPLPSPAAPNATPILKSRTFRHPVATNISSFTKGHPDFRALRTATPEIRDAAFGLKFNHADHLKKDLTGNPNGEKVTLQCAYCHQVEDPAGRDTAHSGRMANVSFERSCQSCHSLDFSPKVKEQAPHAEAAKSLEFLRAKMAEAAPGDKAAIVTAETILFRQKCALCHTVGNIDALPSTNITNRLNNSGAAAPAGNLRNASFSPVDLQAALTETPTIAPSHAPEPLLHRRPLQPHRPQHRSV
jgi:cytochrome c2